MNTRNWKRVVQGVAGLTIAAGITYACRDFLDLPTQGTVDEQTLATRAGVEGSLIAAYRSLDCSSSSAGSWGCAASNWVWGSVASDDAYKGSDAGDQQPINEVEAYFWAAPGAQTYLNQKWSQVYEGVSRANATLRLLEKVRAEKPGEIADADADGIRGEALFLRAHYHFEAYRMWGNIPYYREGDTDFRKTNVGVNAIAEILADLNEAITLLPATPRNGDKGRATSWAAKAYKGRVQVYGAQNDATMWDSALVTLRDVVNNGPYDLQPSFDQVWTGFAQYQNGPETILAFQASAQDGEPSGWNSNWGERLNFPHSGSYFGCCGFHQPSQNLVNFFAVDANGLPLAVTNANWNTTSALSDTNFAGGMTNPVDPRLDWTVGRDWVPYKNWGLHRREWIRDAGYSGPYSPKKNIHENGSDAEHNAGWVPTQTNNVNIHIFRYADVLLLLAEAEVERGSLANALALVNQVRARAGQVAQWCGLGFSRATDSVLLARYPTCAGETAMTEPMVQAGGISSLTTPWAVYRIGQYPSFPDQAYARRAVWYERRLELAMEGQRFFDLRRWKAADTTINNYLAVERTRRAYLAAASPFEPRHALYPIPTIQLELSRVGTEDRLQQNPGW
ncbi:MAG TPA: RagB/SusD family nutrient uptake outer membrane protein [Gemmatimonadales bacterium]|nr:RagB/SusD family nutrient uptake outer membrane protein [Gemmatimonadales bacterium]